MESSSILTDLILDIHGLNGGLSRARGKLWQDYSNCYIFEHKTQYILIRAPYTRIVVFWHISNIPRRDFAESN